jgi:NADH-quinone oxidoreductase subunit C
VWPGAAWHERETHEMFGIDFEGFDDGSGLGLRPLLLPNGFEGTPLRKSFVLASRVSKAWPGAKEPGEGGEGAPEGSGPPGSESKPAKPGRRKIAPPGLPDSTWGPR